MTQCKICQSSIVPFFPGLFDDRHGYRGRFDILRCAGCGCAFTYPEIPPDQIGDLYTNYYPRKNINIEELKNRKIVLESAHARWWNGVNNTAHYHIRTGSRVLDVGCGDCTSLREIQAMGGTAVGIERDRNVEAIAGAFGLDVRVGGVDQFPFPAGSFDYVTMSQVLEHISDPREVLGKIRTILTPGGRCIIGVPNVDSRLRKVYGRRWLNWHVPYHVVHFSIHGLRILAETTGFAVDGVRTYTPNLWLDLQERLARYPVREGAPVPFFNGLPDDGPQISTSLTGVGKAGKIIAILSLRLHDALMAGESILITLRRKN